MGTWDTIKDVTGINDVVKGVRDVTGASAITKALSGAGRADAGGHNDGHTTSGMDKAMQDHADKMHPVGGAVDPGQLTRNPDGSISFPK